MDRSWWRVLTKCGQNILKGWQNTSRFLLPEHQEQYKKAKRQSKKDELLRSVGAQYATGDQQRNNSRKSEEMQPKQKQHPVVDVTGDASKV